MSKIILVVDDDVQIQSFLKENLEDIGFTVLSSADGKDALKQASLNNPDLILLDIEMGHTSGQDTLVNLKKNTKTREIPVIMLTGFDDEKNLSSAIESYADKFITKPFDIKKLIEEIQKTLNTFK